MQQMWAWDKNLKIQCTKYGFRIEKLEEEEEKHNDKKDESDNKIFNHFLLKFKIFYQFKPIVRLILID